jgi:uncharacterized membrane protein
MIPILKLLLFFVLAGIICITGYISYRYFNEKINSSRTLPELLLYSLLLIAINICIYLFGMLALVKTYDMLSDV